MNRKSAATRFWLAASLGAMLLQACSRTAPPVAAAKSPEGQTVAPVSTSASAATARATTPVSSDTPPSLVVPTVPARVTITAVNGNIFIHRGPDLAFNRIAVLTKGQTAVATARDVLSRWVQILVPGDPHMTGWITLVTDYTLVTGNVQGLPEIQPTVWPELATLRNCTHHLMVANPGGITIPAVDYFPDNEMRINPGIYTILDLDVDEYPDVLTVDIREGSAIDITVDGTGERKKCPLP